MGIAPSLYAATVSPSSITGATPKDTNEKRHHLNDGKGFTNPWVSEASHRRRLSTMPANHLLLNRLVGETSLVLLLGLQ